MSKATKRKHVAREVLEEYVIPNENQQVVRVACGRGNNLHEVENTNGERFLASMPTKFRKNVWIKRGDFVVIESIEEGDKVKAEIVHILYKHHIKYLQENNLWPKEFSNPCGGLESSAIQNSNPNSNSENSSYNSGSESENDEEDENDLFVNTNRPRVTYELSSDSSSDNESESDEP